MAKQIDVQKTLKNLIILIVICVLSFSLTGCADKHPKDIDIDVSRVEQRVNGEVHAKSYMRKRR